MNTKPIKKVVIIGAGFAGLRTLSALSEYGYKLEITVVDKREYSILKPDLPDVAVLEKEPDEVEFSMDTRCVTKRRRYVLQEH